jgi:CBS domain containing-hemolysin-like protein
MEGETGELAGSGTAILVLAAYVGAMLVAGLMTAVFRVGGLYRNGLLEADRLGRVLLHYLQATRQFMVILNTMFLILAVLGCFAWGRQVASWWQGDLDYRFHLVLVLSLVLAWYGGSLLIKRLVSLAPLAYARTLGILLWPLFWMLRPWAAFLLWIMDAIDDTLWTGEALAHLSSGEIRSLLTEENGNVTLEEDEREMIHSIFSFHDTAVREIMVPRIDMVSLESSDPVAQVVDVINKCRHSRIPVHEGSVDKVTGILYAKDLLSLVEGGRLATEGKVVGDLARPAYYIPESKKIDEVLEEFRAKRIHMAIVIDEYGGTAGLVTLEDVLEEIVGEIEDEFDEEERLIEWVDERALRVDPKINLEDLQEVLGIGLPEGENETLGGLIYEAAGNVPAIGDQVEVANLKVTVDEVADQRMLRVTLSADEPFPGFNKFD